MFRAAFRRLLAIDDPPERTALAFSIGVFIAFSPFLGLHTLMATALAFLAWFVFAPQCISTIAVTRRETNGWRWPLFMVTYLFVLAYLAAGATYWIAVAAGL